MPSQKPWPKNKCLWTLTAILLVLTMLSACGGTNISNSNPSTKPTATSTTSVITHKSTPTSTSIPTKASNKPERVNPICSSAHLDELARDVYVNRDLATKQLKLMKQAGIKHVRMDFPRYSLEPSKGVWD